MLPPHVHLEVAGPRGGLRALLAHGAVRTIALGEIHNADLIAIRILTGRPQAAALPPGTRHRLRLPIDREAGNIEALLRLGLPGGIQGDRADECHGMVLMRRGQIGGVHIPGIQQMLGGQRGTMHPCAPCQPPASWRGRAKSLPGPGHLECREPGCLGARRRSTPSVRDS
jgi:hypothetical protein